MRKDVKEGRARDRERHAGSREQQGQRSRGGSAPEVYKKQQDLGCPLNETATEFT